MAERTVISDKAIDHLNDKRRIPLQLKNHKDEVAKRNRNAGKSYTGRNKQFHQPKQPPSLSRVCNSRSCNHSGCLISLQKRVHLFHLFYRMSNYETQMNFLIGLVERQDPARRTMGNNSRTSTFRCCLLDEGRRVPVCQMTFLDTFQIGQNRLRTIQVKLKTDNYTTIDGRGKHSTRPHKLPNSLILKIQEHIDKFPATQSHYARQTDDPDRKYLPQELNITIMFNMFVEENIGDPRVTRVKWAYTKEFHKKKLRFGHPRADTCKLCDKLFVQISSAPTPAAKIKLEAEATSHHIESESGYEKIKDDIHESMMNKNYVVLCVDLQQVLFCPTLTHADVFYQRQFASYNFCIWNARSDDATMCFWDETDGKRGSTEMCSCILRYITENFDVLQLNQRRTLVIWSDRCVGQNNNFLTIALYKFLVQEKFFTEIVQKFMVTGHSFLPCDRLFGLIEQRKLVCMAYHPCDWVQIIIGSRPGNPFKIQLMDRADFMNLEVLVELIPRPPTLKVTEIVYARIVIEDVHLIYTKSSHSKTSAWESHTIYHPYSKGLRYCKRALWDPSWMENLRLDKKYEDEIPISKAKKADLVSMCQYLMPEYRLFYMNLTSE